MTKDVQAKDLSEEAILSVLQKNPSVWHTHWAGTNMPRVFDPTHPDAPEKVLCAKLRAMAKKGLIHGSPDCPVDSRGDWHVDQVGVP